MPGFGCQLIAAAAFLADFINPASAKVDFDTPFRPQVHFSPPQNWLGRPCGAFRDSSATWHVYYLHDAKNLVPTKSIQWGHATSDDLYHWTNQDAALVPDQGANIGCGSVVIDEDNTSGFFPNQRDGVAAIYTVKSSDTSSLAMSISDDNGYSFRDSVTPIDVGHEGHNIRDPNVIWHAASQRWIMTASHSTHGTVEFYASSDLRNWRFISEYQDKMFSRTTIESPNLVRAGGASEDELYLLIVSTSTGNAHGNGSAAYYIPGHFNGTHFRSNDTVGARLIDFGPDNYGTIVFSTASSDNDYADSNEMDSNSLIAISTATNLVYSQDGIPAGAEEGWRGTLTLPRTLQLISDQHAPTKEFHLVSSPYNFSHLLEDSGPVMSCPLSSASSDMVSAADVLCGFNFAYRSGYTPYVEATFTRQQGMRDSWSGVGYANFTFRTGSPAGGGDAFRCGFVFRSDEEGEDKASFWVMRDSGMEPKFGEKDAGERVFTLDDVEDINGTWRLQIFVDRSIAEVYINDGRYAATFLLYPDEALKWGELGGSGLPPTIDSYVTVSLLKSGWRDEREEEWMEQSSLEL